MNEFEYDLIRQLKQLNRNLETFNKTTMEMLIHMHEVSKDLSYYEWEKNASKHSTSIFEI